MIDDREKIRNADTSPDACEEENARNGYNAPQAFRNLSVFSVLRELAGCQSRPVMRAILGNRVTWSAIQHWDKGREHIPAWALTLLDAELSRRIRRLERLQDWLKRKERPLRRSLHRPRSQ